MLKRPTLVPPIDTPGLILAGVLEHVRFWQADTLATADTMRSARAQVDELAARMESPQAAQQFIDELADFFVRLAADFDRVLEQLEAEVTAGQGEALLGIAATAAAREPQVLAFRDKWVNRPLPYEDVRPLLNQISIAPRDQLLDYHRLREAAAQLQPPPPAAPAPEPSAAAPAEMPPSPRQKPGEDERAIGRRDLLAKFFRRDR
jgi:hypothetical protein